MTTILSTFATVLVAGALGAALWTLAEYLLHRFAMHELKGKGMMSREHLEHHVTSSWSFSSTHLLSWTGMLLVGAVLWLPLGWLVAGPLAGASLAVGWAVGYFFYEYQHAVAHLRGPGGRYGRWLRHHHFHHHFGHPMANHGVSIPLWDVVFRTREQPEVVRVPRRLVLAWMVDEHGELREEFVGQYVLVGSADSDARLAGIDRARAFASVAPVD
jgi:sterol desaturase/sphingolipid hydroxylase (fatty acid hydroxylase superfamily)